MINHRRNQGGGSLRAVALLAGFLAPGTAFGQMYCSSIYGSTLTSDGGNSCSVFTFPSTFNVSASYAAGCNIPSASSDGSGVTWGYAPASSSPQSTTTSAACVPFIEYDPKVWLDQSDDWDMTPKAIAEVIFMNLPATGPEWTGTTMPCDYRCIYVVTCSSSQGQSCGGCGTVQCDGSCNDPCNG